VGGSRRFCVHCGHQLKPDSQFCVTCGQAASGAERPQTARADSEQATKASGYEASGYEAPVTAPVLDRDDAVRPGAPAGGPTWPSKGSYYPTEPSKGSYQPTEAGQWRSTGQPPSGPAVQPLPRPPSRPARRPSRPRPPARKQRPPRRLAVGLAVLLTCGLAAAVVFFVTQPSHAGHGSAGTTPSSAANQNTARPATVSPSASFTSASSPAQISEQQAASTLAGLLTLSGTDRSSIAAAVSDVNQCGSTLSQDPQAFQNAAASRQRLLGQLASLPGRATLPAAMLQELTGAWQASVAADQDLGRWAQDEVSGCTPNDQANANFQAADGPDGQATTDKKAFVSQWNSIASRYGLRTYQWNQL
jgi:zinc-ribbon domain